KSARGEFKPARGPRRGFSFGAKVDDLEQTLELKHGAFESHIAGLAVHLAGVAQLERGKRPVLLERLPDRARVVADASPGVEAFVVTRRGSGIAHGEKVGQQRQRDKRSAALEVFGVERAALPAEIVFPVPDFFSVRRSEEHTSELQSRENLVCRLLLEKKKKKKKNNNQSTKKNKIKNNKTGS